MHDIDNGHECPKCGHTSICTIEDGDCDNEGNCSNCQNNWLDSLDPDERQWREDMQWRHDEATRGLL